jgi:hypothetical protein
LNGKIDLTETANDSVADARGPIQIACNPDFYSRRLQIFRRRRRA